MTKLIPTLAKNTELEHIRHDVLSRLSVLQKRLPRLTWTTVVMGSVTAILVVLGLITLYSGQLPDAIQIISGDAHEMFGGVVSDADINKNKNPMRISEIQDDFLTNIILSRMAFDIVFNIAAAIGLISAVFKAFAKDLARCLFALASSSVALSMPFILDSIEDSLSQYNQQTEYIATKYDDAIKGKEWGSALSIIEPIPSAGDAAMLKAQLTSLAGRGPESIQLIEDHDLARVYPAESWMLETRFAQDYPEAGHQMSQAAIAYAEGQEEKRNLGRWLLVAAAPMLAGSLLVGAITFRLRRNTKKITKWLVLN